jgi:Na+:H+ antiporter, NhaA family
LRDFKLGYEPWHLQLSLGHWASDGLLVLFFFIAGLQLKREFVSGDLRRPSRAVVPVAAAVGGVAAPAIIYSAIVWNAGADALRGWAIPTATDIAFALAVLAVINTMPLASATWGLVHASGIHATVAGVLLGFTVPVAASRRETQQAGTTAGSTSDAGGTGMAARLEHLLRPLSAGFAVPVFAFFSA